MTDEPITIERTYAATPERVWELWTTASGIEAWWGPDGFAVTVRALDLRPGGELRYVMTAVGEPQQAFMERAGMALETEALIRFVEVSPPRRLAYLHRADFVPGIEPYDVAITVELAAAAGGTRLVLTTERMHDEAWTAQAIAGWEQELARLEGALARS